MVGLSVGLSIKFPPIIVNNNCSVLLLTITSIMKYVQMLKIKMNQRSVRCDLQMGTGLACRL